MLNATEFHQQCALTALSALIVSTHQDIGKDLEGDFYTIPQLVEDAYRYANAMAAYQQAHPLESTLPGQVSYLSSDGAPYQTKPNLDNDLIGDSETETYQRNINPHKWEQES